MKFVYRAKLRVEVGTGFITVMPGVGIDHTERMSFCVSNVGSEATTLTNITFRAFEKARGWKRWKRPSRQGIITVRQIPARLEPGSIWSEMVPQESMREFAANFAECVICFHHSMARQPVAASLTFSGQIDAELPT
ncbi:MAG TPA: hypothetical protein VIL60_10685 [Rhodanobacter sp.]